MNAKITHEHVSTQQIKIQEKETLRSQQYSSLILFSRFPLVHHISLHYIFQLQKLVHSSQPSN